MKYAIERLIGLGEYVVALKHDLQPSYRLGSASDRNVADSLDRSVAWFRDFHLAEAICETLNALKPSTAAEFARLEILVSRLPAEIEARELPRLAEIDLYAEGRRIGRALRADGRPGRSEAELVTTLRSEANRAVASHRRRFVAEIVVAGSSAPALVDRADEAAVVAAGPWSWSGSAVTNAAGVRLQDYILEPLTMVEEVVTGDAHDLRRCRLVIRPTVKTVSVEVPECAVVALQGMSAAELGALVLRGAA